MADDDDYEDRRPKNKRRRDDDEDYEERPRSRRRDDDEDYEPPRSRRSRDDEDDFEERPRRRRRDEEYDDEDVTDRRLSRSDLRAIAGHQKAILLCILVNICLTIAQFTVPDDNLRLILALVSIPIAIAATVFVFLLSTKIYSSGVGVLLGILTLIPCIGLIVLLVINGKATSLLKSRGIHVGLLGARTSDI
ncbi:Uncharacterized protein OS=Fimbriimonas ginsengisoli Gsoil 348 GN=OP10G_3938 PE=4 SV=1 [Gemmata massiliana]|uniref:Uncharacterized protein n=1 Tax=Gemmata massiliana TaxID=1210884 RepID=A0A6P2CS37_9BACT|nr:hypothetical protein [Gemmata massiliana]VTR91166.1 Uncharacterized protein OS=Fimbriimonas ginsengisoli Gsoil 348 GN=OP10G_3938 PE=4 SV=1 [Gemmata massiliana]